MAAAAKGKAKAAIEAKRNEMNEPTTDTALSCGDDRRHKSCQPGHLVYSAAMNQELMEKFYCWSCLCQAKEVAARRSFVDVYTNGVHTNAPLGSCCCCYADKSVFIFYDDTRTDTMGKASCCNPINLACWCPHGFNMCGEGFYFMKFVGAGPAALPLGAGHVGGCVPLLPCVHFCICDTVLGLADGEGDKVLKVIGDARKKRAQPIQRSIPSMK